ncbi:MAG: alpha/beta hydrolase [Sphingomicrobium sp.]
MANFTTTDGTNLFYRDWGAGQPVVFSHGWPLSGEAWSAQMQFLAANGYRTIAHDRRGHGRSDQPSGGNTMDRYADDLGELIDKLDLKDIILVGHSTGGGEVVRYVGRHGASRVAGVVTVSAIPPLMLKTDANPDGVPAQAFDEIRQGLLAGRSDYYRALAEPFFGANRPGATVAQGIKDEFWLLSMQCGLKAAYECIDVFSATDHNADLRKIDVPMLIIHGAEDQIVPIGNSAEKTAKIVAGSVLKVYPGAPHGLPQTRTAEFNADLLAFAKGLKAGAPGQQAERTLAPTDA